MLDSGMSQHTLELKQSVLRRFKQNKTSRRDSSQSQGKRSADRPASAGDKNAFALKGIDHLTCGLLQVRPPQKNVPIDGVQRRDHMESINWRLLAHTCLRGCIGASASANGALARIHWRVPVNHEAAKAQPFGASEKKIAKEAFPTKRACRVGAAGGFRRNRGGRNPLRLASDSPEQQGRRPHGSAVY